MTKLRIWQGVRMRKCWVGADPDAPVRLVVLPAAWDDGAAASLAALVPGDEPVALATLADAWVRRLVARQGDARDGLAEALHTLLLLRRAAPSPAIWRDEPGPRGFVLNLASFHDPQHGFDIAGFEAALDVIGTALGDVPGGFVAVADLAGLLAALGLEYDSAQARAVGAGIAALLRARLGDASGPEVPEVAAIEGLNEAIRSARATPLLLPRIRAVATLPGEADALLGVEIGGIAPAFAPVDPDGRLTASARAFLAAQGYSAETALAAFLSGENPLAIATPAAHAAMHDVVAPFLHALPPRPEEAPAARAEGVQKRELPTRHGGYTQRAIIGGHRLFLRTGEYANGRLGEIDITLSKEAPAFRALMDQFAHAVSIGLQHGVALDEYVEAFAHTRFGPAGAVEGDAAVTRASSLLDYAFRHLAANYLGKEIPPAAEDGLEQVPAAPLLPMDLPRNDLPRSARGKLRVVR